MTQKTQHPIAILEQNSKSITATDQNLENPAHTNLAIVTWRKRPREYCGGFSKGTIYDIVLHTPQKRPQRIKSISWIRRGTENNDATTIKIVLT